MHSQLGGMLSLKHSYVRIARDVNTAMLGKFVWDMQQNTNKPWVHMLHDKYRNYFALPS
jgi:hypothetical protein